MINVIFHRQSRGPNVMMDPGERTSRWIGLAAFFVAAVLLNDSLPADMLPINRALVAVNCALITAWLLLRAVRSGDRPR